MSVILASASPRRKELLEMLGIKDMLIIPARGEETVPENVGGDRVVEALALQKCREVAAERDAEDIVIAADTIVWVDGEIFGKPHSAEEAAGMLRRLSGRAHQVYTGVAVIRGGREICRSEMSEVFFRQLSDSEISAYIATGEPMDKAGAYGAQGKAAVFVRAIHGDFFNVMGLPLCLLDSMLTELGASILEGRGL